MLQQKYEKTSPVSPRLAKVERLKDGWSVFLTWKFKNAGPSDDKPAFISGIAEQTKIDQIATAWVDKAERPAPRGKI